MYQNSWHLGFSMPQHDPSSSSTLRIEMVAGTRIFMLPRVLARVPTPVNSISSATIISPATMRSTSLDVAILSEVSSVIYEQVSSPSKDELLMFTLSSSISSIRLAAFSFQTWSCPSLRSSASKAKVSYLTPCYDWPIYSFVLSRTSSRFRYSASISCTWGTSASSFIRFSKIFCVNFRMRSFTAGEALATDWICVSKSSLKVYSSFLTSSIIYSCSVSWFKRFWIPSFTTCIESDHLIDSSLMMNFLSQILQQAPRALRSSSSASGNLLVFLQSFSHA